jgi:hypothetical protein
MPANMSKEHRLKRDREKGKGAVETFRCGMLLICNSL